MNFLRAILGKGKRSQKEIILTPDDTLRLLEKFAQKWCEASEEIEEDERKQAIAKSIDRHRRKIEKRKK